MNKDIIILKNGQLLLSKNLSNKIIYLSKNISWLKKENLKKDKENKVSPFLLTSILCDIEKNTNNFAKEYLTNDLNQSKNFDNLLFEDLKKDLTEYNSWNNQNNTVYTIINKKNTEEENNKNTILSLKLIDKALNISKKVYTLNYIADLNQTIKDLKLSLKYCLTEQEINNYISQYNTYISNYNITNAKQIVIEMQQILLNEWKKYTTNIEEYIPGKDFNFLCHSTHTTNFKGNFQSPYISCSLFNQDIHETYNKEFGFILAPHNIVGTSSRDMFINNYAQTEEDLQSYSLVLPIEHPKKILQDCIKRKKQKKNILKSFPTYNEIVIKGFYPIAIFSLTNGTKNLDPNYKNARLLQKKFPNLKIIDIDLLLYDKGEDLIKVKIETIKNIQLELSKTDKNITINNIDHIINKDTIDKYDLFFDKFSKLKTLNTYSTKEIISIFKHNHNLINPKLKNAEIFGGQYNAKEIKYILRKNPRFNIDKILAKNFNYGDLITLINSLEKDAKNLNLYFPGLEEFNQIAQIAKPYFIYAIQIEELKKLNNLNFYTMSKFMLENIIKKQTNQHQNIVEEISNKLK